MTVLTYGLAGSVWNKTVYMASYIFSIAMTAFPLLAFYMLFPLFPQFIAIYSQIIALSNILMSVYLILTAFLGTLLQPQYVLLLSDNAVFGFGILVDYLTGGRYEPVRFGWQTLFHSETAHQDPAEILDCSEFLRYVYSETLPYADANGIYYHLELPPQICSIYCHREKLFRAFENLVMNATEHTPMEGAMTLSAVYTKDSVAFTFRDNGEGID